MQEADKEPAVHLAEVPKARRPERAPKQKTKCGAKQPREEDYYPEVPVPPQQEMQRALVPIERGDVEVFQNRPVDKVVSRAYLVPVVVTSIVPRQPAHN